MARYKPDTKSFYGQSIYVPETVVRKLRNSLSRVLQGNAPNDKDLAYMARLHLLLGARRLTLGKAGDIRSDHSSFSKEP